MRIVILSDRIPPESIGGAGKAAWMLGLGLQRAGHDVRVVAATEGAPFRDRREGIVTDHVHARYPERFRGWLSLYNPQTIPALRRLLEEIRPDVVNGHNIHRDLSYASLSLAHRLGSPAVFTSHDVMPFAYGKLDAFVDPARCGVDSPARYRLPPLYNLRQMRLRYNPLRNLVIRRILRHHTRARTCVSEAHRQALEANGLPPFRVVYGGLDPAGFAAPASAVEKLRQRLDLAGRRVILFGGRIGAQKGTRQLLAALSRVAARVPAALLLVLASATPGGHRFGDAEFQWLRERHIREGGWLAGEDLAAAYYAADVVTVPSIVMDCAPMVNLEAMLAARPVVATCYGGSPEFVVDGQTGYVVNPFDTATFAERLERLLVDAELRQRMGEAGRRRLEERFTLTRQVAQVVAVYRDAMAPR